LIVFPTNLDLFHCTVVTGNKCENNAHIYLLDILTTSC